MLVIEQHRYYFFGGFIYTLYQYLVTGIQEVDQQLWGVDGDGSANNVRIAQRDEL